jgi:hypothetical protein
MFVGASLSSWRIADQIYVGKQILWYCQLSLVLNLPTLTLKPVIESTTIDLPVKKYPAEYGW